jgi:hypothetical protein
MAGSAQPAASARAKIPWEDALALEIIQVDLHLKAVQKICSV